MRQSAQGSRRRRRSVVAVASAGVLVTAALLAGCSSSGTSGGKTSGANYVSGDGTITVLSSDERAQPISLGGSTVEGARVDLASFRGKTVVLNVWGSWCPPCRKEAPDLEAAYQQLKGSGVEFLGINYRDDDPAQAIAYQKAFGVTYPSVVDDGGNLLLALRGAVSAKSIPSTLILDGEGRIAARVNGPTTRTTLVDLVQGVQTGHVTVGPSPVGPSPDATAASASPSS